MKGSEDFDFSLVFNKNLNKMFPFCRWDPVPGDLGQKGVNVYHL